MPMPNQITVTQGATLRLSLITPWDLTGYAFAAELEDIGDPTMTYPLTVGLVMNPATGLMGTLTLLLGAGVTALLIPGHPGYNFDVKLTAPNGDISYPTGKIGLLVDGRITP